MKIKYFHFLFLICLSLNLAPKNSGEYKEIVESLGLSFEIKQVQTEDNYINTIWKVYDPNNFSTQRAVLLQHGLLDNSWTFLANKEKSLCYTLAKEGYIVYLNNVRGNMFSKDHTDLSWLNPFGEFWNFSFDEMAKYDLPTAIKFIKEKELISELYYVGHSQGTLTYFLANIINPEFMAKNIKKFAAIGTVPNVNRCTSKLVKFLHESNLLDLYPIGNVMTIPEDVGKILSMFCNAFPNFCGTIVNFIIEEDGASTGRIDYPKISENLFLFEPGGTSLKNMKHWIQIYGAKKLQMYDYGEEQNLKVYGSKAPPEYDVNKMKDYKIPSLVTTSDTDPFAHPQDTLDFVNNADISGDVFEVLKLHKYNHLDYCWAESAKEDIYEKIIEFFMK